MGGRKIEVGEVYGDVTCVEKHYDKEIGRMCYTWKCVCGKEIKARKRVHKLLTCQHGEEEPPKPKRNYQLPDIPLPHDSPCRKCEFGNLDYGCTKFKSCPDWRLWFRKKWSFLQRKYGVR